MLTFNTDVVFHALVVVGRGAEGVDVVEGEGVGDAGAEGVLHAAEAFAPCHAGGVTLISQVDGAGLGTEVEGGDAAGEASEILKASIGRTRY